MVGVTKKMILKNSALVGSLGINHLIPLRSNAVRVVKQNWLIAIW